MDTKNNERSSIQNTVSNKGGDDSKAVKQIDEEIIETQHDDNEKATTSQKQLHGETIYLENKDKEETFDSPLSNQEPLKPLAPESPTLKPKLVNPFA